MMSNFWHNLGEFAGAYWPFGILVFFGMCSIAYLLSQGNKKSEHHKKSEERTDTPKEEKKEEKGEDSHSHPKETKTKRTVGGVLAEIFAWVFFCAFIFAIIFYVIIPIWGHRDTYEAAVLKRCVRTVKIEWEDNWGWETQPSGIPVCVVTSKGDTLRDVLASKESDYPVWPMLDADNPHLAQQVVIHRFWKHK